MGKSRKSPSDNLLGMGKKTNALSSYMFNPETLEASAFLGFPEVNTSEWLSVMMSGYSLSKSTLGFVAFKMPNTEQHPKHPQKWLDSISVSAVFDGHISDKDDLPFILITRYYYTPPNDEDEAAEYIHSEEPKMKRQSMYATYQELMTAFREELEKIYFGKLPITKSN